jgi:hypothetical protein
MAVEDNEALGLWHVSSQAAVPRPRPGSGPGQGGFGHGPGLTRGMAMANWGARAAQAVTHWKKVTRFPSASTVANSRDPKSVSLTPSRETGCSTSRELSSS